MFQNDRDYEPAVKALAPVLHNLPGKIVAIDGLPGVGKTTLGRYLAFRFNVSLVETDLFLVSRQGAMVYRENWLNQIIGIRIDRADHEWRRPVIVEGATVLYSVFLHLSGASRTSSSMWSTMTLLRTKAHWL